MGETLLPRNQEYFKRLEQYVGEAIGVDSVAAADMLAEIYRDLLQAQADGIEAQDYFGDDPKAIGDQLIKNLPHRSRKFWIIFVMLAWGTSFCLTIWKDISDYGRMVPLGSAAVLSMILPVVVLLALEFNRRRSFRQKKLRSSSLILVVVIQLVILPLNDFFPKFGMVMIPKLLIVGAGFAVAIFLIGFGIWLGMHSWVFAGILAVGATYLSIPAADALGTLPGWWGRLLIPMLFVGSLLLIRIGEHLLPDKWQADGGK